MNIEQEILRAKGKNWARLVAKKADEIAKSMENEIDYMIKILNGDIFDIAVLQVAYDIKAGKYDEMLMPKECNL